MVLCWKKLSLMSNRVSLMSKWSRDMWFQGGNDDVVVVDIYCLGMYNEDLNPLKNNLRNPLITSVNKLKAVLLWRNNCAWPS